MKGRESRPRFPQSALGKASRNGVHREAGLKVPKKLQPFTIFGLEFTGTSGDTHMTADCPFCDKAKHLFVNIKSTQYKCHVCLESGNLTTFLTTMMELTHDDTPRETFGKLRKLRGIPSVAFKRWGLAHDTANWLIPHRNKNGNVVNVVTWAGPGQPMKSAPGCSKGLFGMDRLAKAAKGAPIWVCEGEWDTMALTWLLRRFKEPGVVVGVPGAGTFKDEWVPLFRGRNVVLVFDADAAGDQGAAKAVEKLRGRCASINSVAWPDKCRERKKGFDVSDWIAHGWADHRDEFRGCLTNLKRQIEPVEVEAAGDTGDDSAYAFTERGVAIRVRKEHGDDLLFVPNWRDFVHYDGRRWKRESGIERPLIDSVVATIAAESVGNTDAMKRAASLCRHRAIVGVAGCLSNFDSLRVSPSVFDRNPDVLNVANGTVDLQTGALQQHLRADCITQVASIDFDPAAKCPWFVRFLREIQPDPAMRHYLQTALGYSLTGRTDEHVLFVAWGPTRTGKSTLFDSVLRIVGDYGYEAPTSLLLHRKGNDRPATEAADLFRKRFVTSRETDERARLNESLIKHLTGGDRITTRRLYENLWSFDPTHTLWLFTNHKPNVSGDGAMWSRVRLLPFEQHIPDERRDPRLKQRLWKERAGILAWLVRGAQRYLRDGLTEPDCVRAATADYREESDELGQFINDCLVQSEGESVACAALFKRYEAWAAANGIRLPWKQRRLTSALKDRGFEYRKHPNRHFIRLRLKERGAKR